MEYTALISGFKGAVTRFQGVISGVQTRVKCLQPLAVVYIKVEASCGNCVNFVASKTKVAPVNKHTIPRLELLSALLANLVEGIKPRPSY